MKPAVSNVKNYFSRITSESRVGLIHHTDPDGVISGVLATKLFERITGQKLLLRMNQKSNEIPLNNSTIDSFKEKNISHVIITDLNVDEKMESLQKIASFCDVLLLDHHTLIAQNGKNLTVLKPQMFSEINPTRYCASKLVYDLGEMLGVDLIDHDWLAAIGLIGDIGTESFPSFMNSVFERHGFSLKENLFDTELGLCAQYISATEAYDWKNVGEAYEVAYNASSYQDILCSSLKKYHGLIQDEITRNVQTVFNIPAEDGLVYGQIKSSYSIKSKIGTIISLQKPDLTIMLTQEQGDKIVVSLRRSDGSLHLSEIVRDSMKGLDGMGGGHQHAAGATVSKKDFPEFLRRIKERHKNG